MTVTAYKVFFFFFKVIFTLLSPGDYIVFHNNENTVAWSIMWTLNTQDTEHHLLGGSQCEVGILVLFF